MKRKKAQIPRHLWQTGSVRCCLLAVIFLVFAGCARPGPRTTGTIHRDDSGMNELLPEGAHIEILADGLDWAEGPVWVPALHRLLFSDIPKNTVYQWGAESGLSVYLRPAGYMWDDPAGEELGSNGLVLDTQGRLVLCDHGNRAISRLNTENFTKTILTDRYEGQRLNSPNDAVFKSNGDLYFTDPPYGLEGLNQSPEKELDFNGVYRLTRAGRLDLLVRDLTFPNGIGFSPDEQRLYVAVSDPDRPVWMVYDVEADGTLANGRVFADATPWQRQDLPGLPDGLTVDGDGNLFASGPGGIHVFAPDGTHLGRIETGQTTANCTFGGEDGSVLFMTADAYLCRIQTTTHGQGF